MSTQVIDDARTVARSAARWLALIESGTATERDHAGLQRWREQHPGHEQAWQKAQALRTRFGGLPSELAMASLDRPDHGRRRLLKGVLGLAATAPAAWMIARELPVDAWRADLATATGERRRVELADGSVLELNTASAANVDLPGRRVTLVRGELALQVAAGAPFVIDGGQAWASFDGGQLCLRRHGDTCEFSVLAGNVEVHPVGSAMLRLQAGERVRLRGGIAEPTQRFDPRMPGWREGVIMASNRPLGDFLRELDRHRPGILRWSAKLESLRVTGSFRLDDTDRVLALLAASLPLEVRSRTRYWVTLVPRERIS